ncbi:MAG: peptidoglycan binding domain-containing protein, partial [Chloroflexota bacterium]
MNSKPTPLRPRRRFKLSLGGFRFWLAVSAIGILGSLVLLLVQILLFARSLDRLPSGLIIAGVPVGGLTAVEATARLSDVYNTPLTLDYRGSTFQLTPSQVGFTLDADAMLAQAPSVEVSGSLWSAFWLYLWAQTPPPPDPIPLQASFDQTLLEDFLADVAVHYDDPGTPPQADPETLGFVPGTAGYALDREAAFALINTALRSPTARSAALPVNDFAQSPPTFNTLTDLLYTGIRLHQFDGTVSIYIADLQTGETINIAMHSQQPFDVDGGLAYSGMSTIKIPIMVTFFRYLDDAATPDEQTLLKGVFGESANTYTDLILGILGANQNGGGLVGANIVSDTMAELGLQNTYIAGLLDTLGAITTPRITPANTRTDIDLAPDRFNQTSADDMGRLLVMIYECTEGRGKLIETLPSKFTADECRQMIDLLKSNEVGPIFIVGGSPGATVA